MKEKLIDLHSVAKKLKKRKRASYMQFFFSAISLFIVVAVFITSSTAWYSIKTTKSNAQNFSLECGKGLRVNDSGTSDFQMFDSNKNIYPASSVDGRNLFFPADGSFSKKTEDMVFRSSNVGDKNQNYIQIDFTLTAQANNTALYINDDETSVTIKKGDRESTTLAAPLRMAVWSSTAKGGYPNTPVVFNPTAKTYTTAAVRTVDRTSGKFQDSGRQVAHCFSDYAYGGDSLAVLSKGVETKFKIIIWLEGADPKCTYDKVSLSDIILKIKFTTSWDKTQVIRFRDSSTGSWVKGKLNPANTTASLTLRYEDLADHEITDFTMYPYSGTDNEWFCNIPGDMTNKIKFVLTEGNDTYEFTKNSRGSGDTYDRGVNRLYIAENGIAADTSQCQGYWEDLGDSNGGGNDIGDLDGDDF